MKKEAIHFIHPNEDSEEWDSFVLLLLDTAPHSLEMVWENEPSKFLFPYFIMYTNLMGWLSLGSSMGLGLVGLLGFPDELKCIFGPSGYLAH